jgi:hypothetical protein
MNCLLSINFVPKLLLAIVVMLSLSGAVQAKAKEVISPEKFSGPIAAGYKAAQKAKDTCSKLFCYCGCDLSEEHTSLLDCFTSMHGVDCAICQEEAIIAWHMKEQGKSLGQIQKAIDERFAAQYPWDEASPVYESYLKNIKVSGVKIANRTTVRTKDNTKTKNLAKKRAGHCCGH